MHVHITPVEPAFRPVEPQQDTRLQVGSISDADRLIAMHERCSAESIRRRYNAPIPRLAPRLARRIARPRHGWSLLAVRGQDVVGVTMIRPDGHGGAEVGILVEDAWQRQGIGARMLRTIATEATNQGLRRLVCVSQPDNAAVLAIVRRAGLRARVATNDGSPLVTIPLGGRSQPERRQNKLTIGEVTEPLVTLLHRRSELRDVAGPADLIDQTIRAGA